MSSPINQIDRELQLDFEVAPLTTDQPPIDQPPIDQIAIDFRRVPVEQVYFCNMYSASCGREIGMNAQQQGRINQAFAELKSLISPTSTKFEINLSKMVVSYLDNNIEYKTDLAENRYRAIYERLLADVEPLWGRPIHDVPIEARRKTSQNGPIPLVRYNAAVGQLPNSYKPAASLVMHYYMKEDPTNTASHDQALLRIAAVERILSALNKKIDEELKGIARPALPADQNHIQQLEHLRQKLRMDRFAIYMIAAFYPVDNPTEQNLNAAADKVREYAQIAVDQSLRMVLKNLKWRQKLPGFIPEPLRQGAPTIDRNTIFSGDVAGLMYSGLSIPAARLGYLAFCNRHSLVSKADCIEESVIRMAISGPQADPGDMGAALNAITNVQLRTGLETELQNARVAIPANYVFNDSTLEAKIDQLRTDFNLV